MTVHDDSEVEPAGACSDVGEVCHPDLIAGLRRTSFKQAIAFAGIKLLHDRLGLTVRLHLGHDAVMPHQTGYLVTAAIDALLIQRSMHSGIAIGLATAAEHAPDLGQQLGIDIGARTERAAEPVVIATGADAQAVTQTAHAEGGSLLGYESVEVLFLPATNRSNFFRISTSSLVFFKSLSN